MTTYLYRYKQKLHFLRTPPGFHIHHIDFCREHNEFENLVMLPDSLHNEYHKLIPPGNSSFVFPVGLCSQEPDPSDIIRFYEVQHACWRWLEFKEFLCDCLRGSERYRRLPPLSELPQVIDCIDLSEYKLRDSLSGILLQR